MNKLVAARKLDFVWSHLGLETQQAVAVSCPPVEVPTQ